MSKPIGKQVVSPASLDKLVLLARYTEAYDDGVSAWQSQPAYMLSTQQVHEIGMASEKELHRKKKRRTGKTLRTEEAQPQKLVIETLPTDLEHRNGSHSPLRTELSPQKKFTLLKDYSVRDRHRQRTEHSRSDQINHPKPIEVKFPPIYLSNFSHSPKGEHRGLLRKLQRTRVSPEPSIQPQAMKHAVREALLRRLKYSLKPDPFRLFRAKVLPYLEYPTDHS